MVAAPDDIQQTYEQVNRVLEDLDTLHSAIVQKHEADFIVTYKDHMVQVQREMAEYKKKSSDFYLKMKKDEKIKMLEASLGIYKSECINMVASLDKLQKSHKLLITQHKFDVSEIATWKEEAKKLKFHNVILRNTVCQLKSP